MWTVECRKEPFILTLIPFICVTHACPICCFWGETEGCGLLCLFLLYLLCQTTMRQSEQGVYSVLTRLIWSMLLSLPLSLATLRSFYLAIIKSYHSPAPLCVIHLRLSRNHCHTAPLFCSPNWLDLAIILVDWLLWSASSEFWRTSVQTITIKHFRYVLTGDRRRRRRWGLRWWWWVFVSLDNEYVQLLLTPHC